MSSSLATYISTPWPSVLFCLFGLESDLYALGSRRAMITPLASFVLGNRKARIVEPIHFG